MYLSFALSLSSFHPTLFFYDFDKFDCTQHVDWGNFYTLLVTILVIRNGKRIFHLQKILKSDVSVNSGQLMA